MANDKNPILEYRLILTPKLHVKDIYFIFRQDGQEVTVNTSGSYAVASHKLTTDEINYINTYVYMR